MAAHSNIPLLPRHRRTSAAYSVGVVVYFPCWPTVLNPPLSSAGRITIGDGRASLSMDPDIDGSYGYQQPATGAVQFAVSLVILGWMLAPGVDRMWRIAMLLPWWGAAAGFFQWRDKT